VDGTILDLRDGWGGAEPDYLSIFARTVPVLESIDRAGEVTAYDPQIHGPAAILVNEGTRSGNEVIAYGARMHGLARLVGTRTAGAVLAGRPFCLADGSLLYLAVGDIRVDGERLEGRSVQPDIEVPFDLAYAAGQDPQLEQALRLLADE
jgi:carboxyl-terminal processing protease